MLSPILAVLLCVAPASAADTRPITLDEAYSAALKRSEELAEKGYTYAQLVAQIDELWAAVKPRLSLNASQFWQDTPGPGVNFPIPSSQQTVAVAGHQPIFSGFRDFLAVRAARAQTESAAFALERAKELLYQDLAGAYLDLLRSHQDIATRREQVRLTGDRVAELKNFQSIGRSRRSEVLAAQSQLAQNEADLETSLGQERVYQATLRFLTGIDQDLEPQDVPLPAEAADPAPYLARAEKRADVEGARRDLEYSGLYVSIENRQYWPTVAVDGNYYLRRPPTYSRHVNWDATLSAVLPLYWGGQISAQTAEARAQRGYREQALSLALRQARLDVTTAHDALASDLSIVKALQNALSLAEENAKAQAADYRNGLVTNIDVLTSLTTVHDTRLRLDQARAQAYDDQVRLEVAAGGPGSPK